MLAPLTPRTSRQLLSPSARILATAAAPGPIDVEGLPWADVHWPTLLSLAAYERAEAPLFALLRTVPAQVPDDVRAVATGLERVARFRAAELGDSAATVAETLGAVGVPALWLKGAALAMQSPDGFAVRGMGDLDLLVTPADQARARLALARAGWSQPAASGYEEHHHDAPMVGPGGVRLELHGALFPPSHPFGSDTAEDWLARGHEVAWQGNRVLVLPMPWHVVHASVHWAWSHEGTVGTWQYLHDMHRLTAGWPPGGPEWTATVAHATAIGATVPLGWGLWTAHQLGGLAVDGGVVSRLRGGGGALAGLVEREWVLAAFHSPAGSPSVRWSRFWWRRAMRGLGDDGGRWPWAAGRGGVVPAIAAPDAGGAGDRNRWARWRRHLLRLARS